MEIIKVQDKGKVYLINDVQSVAKAPGNRHYSMVQNWLAEEGNELSPAYSIDELKTKLKEELKTIRNDSFISTITHAKGEFSASEGAYTKLSAIVASWNGSTSELWRDVDNNMVSLIKTECKEILRAIKDAHTPIYAKEAIVAIQIDNETDLELLESFDVQAAWDAA